MKCTAPKLLLLQLPAQLRHAFIYETKDKGTFTLPEMIMYDHYQCNTIPVSLPHHSTSDRRPTTNDTDGTTMLHHTYGPIWTTAQVRHLPTGNDLQRQRSEKTEDSWNCTALYGWRDQWHSQSTAFFADHDCCDQWHAQSDTMMMLALSAAFLPRSTPEKT